MQCYANMDKYGLLPNMAVALTLLPPPLSTNIGSGSVGGSDPPWDGRSVWLHAHPDRRRVAQSTVRCPMGEWCFNPYLRGHGTYGFQPVYL